MKKTLVVLVVTMFVGLAAGVQAADVTINPGLVALTVESGKTAAAKLVVNAVSSSPFIAVSMQVGSEMKQGNMPFGWLKPVNINLYSGEGGNASSTVDLEVEVPAGTPAGKYTAVLNSRVIRASEPVSTSGDITVVVAVPALSSCVGVPTLSKVKVGPQNIWAPTEKEVEVNVSGTVVVAPGCEVAGTYIMDNNGGVVSGELDIDGAGNFAVKIPVKVAKNAKSKEANIYNGKLSVVDAIGNMSSQEFFVQVDHDRGK